MIAMKKTSKLEYLTDIHSELLIIQMVSLDLQVDETRHIRGLRWERATRRVGGSVRPPHWRLLH